MLSGFSRQHDYLRCQTAPEGCPYFRRSARAADLPVALTAYGLQRGIPYPRGSVTTASPHRCTWKSRNINRVGHRLRPSAEA